MISSEASADSWEPPEPETYTSSDGETRLTVIPQDLESNLDYFEDKVAGREPAGAVDPAQTSAIGQFERRDASGNWQVVWRKPLDNEVAPVRIVIADGGRGFVTFDNWHAVGRGDNVVVLYDADGDLIRKFSLSDLFPDWFIAGMPHSISSINWRDDPFFSSDGKNVVIPIVQPSADNAPMNDRATVGLAIRLLDGEPIGLSTDRWQDALRRAAATVELICQRELSAMQRWNAPVSAPATTEDRDWHYYLRETQFRSKWPRIVETDTTVLRLSDHPGFQDSVEWLEEALTEKAYFPSEYRAIASPDPTRLATEIERVSKHLKPNQLDDVVLVIVAEGQDAVRIKRALRGTGAKLELIDPDRTFPQVERRLQKRNPGSCDGRQERDVSIWYLAIPVLVLGALTFYVLKRRA